MDLFGVIGGVAEDIVNAAGDVVDDVVEAGADLFEGAQQLAGIVVAGGALYVLGPNAVLIPAFVAGSAMAGALIKHRHMRPLERELAERVFGSNNRLPPNEKIYLTNLIGLGGRAFVCPNLNKDILVNLGAGAMFDSPTLAQNSSYPLRGKLFIHELTHVWQYHHETFTPGVLCEGIGERLIGATYLPGAGGRPWSSYNLEQQGTIVDEWFAPDSRGPVGFAAEAPAHPFFRYVCVDIRGQELPQHAAYGLQFLLPHGATVGPNQQGAWRYCGKCRTMFFDGDLNNKGACPAGGGHLANGFNFVLPHGLPAGANQQSEWRYCGKCRALFYDGAANKGVCAMGLDHGANGVTFVLPHQVVPGAKAQEGWRYCAKCRSMFYDGDPADKGRCSAGDGHSAYGLNFVLPHDDVIIGANRQASWRYCGKCRTLFYALDVNNRGVCPAGGPHAPYGFNFMLPYDVPAGPTQQSAWHYCGKCRAMFYGGDTANSGVCPTGGGHAAHGYTFVLPHQMAAGPDRQDAWRYCGKCRAMFYDGDPNNKGVCTVQ